VVIPTLDEEDHLPALLADLRHLSVSHEVIVVDGGSRDRTCSWARAAGARLRVREPAGRGPQMAAGADAARAPWILFLHADTRLGPDAGRAIEAWIAGASSGEEAAYFGFHLDGTGWFWRFIELGQGLRERLTGLVYGDQGLLVSRELLARVGGVPDLPLMEDVELVRRIRRAGRLERLPASLPTSPRRYREEGRWRGWLRNTALITLFRLGVAPRRLARHYPSGPHTPSDRQDDNAPDHLLVFVKAPRPGGVKTRLAETIGDEEAARVYRVLGRRVVDGVRGGPWRTVVAHAPDDAGPEITAWLGETGLELLGQGSGDLGERMSRAISRSFREGARRVCVVGTDTPDLNAASVARAFGILRREEVVLGPALDGGYYLIGLRRPRPDLFVDMPWSTPRVLEGTVARLDAAGIHPARLRVLRDVDRVADLRAAAPDLLPAS
jgi:rSAM/selenodomain-associated transferase 2/rSAM/selenodomain-associated transferase 1